MAGPGGTGDAGATPTAVLVVVGSEILSAKVKDENGPYAAERLRALGVRLEAIHVVPDRVDDIVDVVSQARRRAGWVLTSGGIGPTHDDVTVGAVACALGRPLLRSEPLAEVFRAGHARHHPGEPLPEAALRMADVPEGTRLLGDPEFPTLVVERVVILPGPPRFFRFQLDHIADLLRAPPFRLASLYLGIREDLAAPALAAVARAHPGVEIGSYPRFDPGVDHRVRVTVEAKDAALVAAAVAAVIASLPGGAVLRTEGP
jgi:molybdenum cofactor synthesis domain-containing protein